MCIRDSPGTGEEVALFQNIEDVGNKVDGLRECTALFSFESFQAF